MQTFDSSAEAPSSDLTLRPVPGLTLRRLILVVPSVLFALAILGLSAAVLARTPHLALDWLMLLPFAFVMIWESFFVWQMILGFISWLRGNDGQSVLEQHAATIEPVATGRSRTALAIPIYEEDVTAVFARVRIIMGSLRRLGDLADIDVHVLSDTRTAATADAEEAAFAALCAETADANVFYRRRSTNAGRKAGNLLEFFERSGTTYDFAIVLDADSLMSGTAVRRLIRLMEENPRCGLIQTVSYAAGRETLFARIQQFAVRLYAPLSLRGLDFWQGAEGSYWGHNAILRIAPFRAHCRLPILPGKPPLGGEILCHDIVEAALLTRAGWETRLLPEFEGTWEEMPTNALDLMGRERRWCQGNLQHARIIALPGLRGASRGHIALGIISYLTPSFWWAFLLLGALRAGWHGGAQGAGLLAFGLTERGPAAALLLAGSLLLAILPRALSILRALGHARRAAMFGSTGRFLVSAALEQAFWVLFGPVLSLVSAGFVVQTLLGRSIGWTSQPRTDRHVPPAEAMRHHLPHMALGVLLAGIAAATGGWYALWMAPTCLGLVLSPVLTMLSSRADLGRWSRRFGLFLTVDDIGVSSELTELAAAARPSKPR